MKKLVKEDYLLLQNIIDRADKMKFIKGERITVVLDLCCAVETFDINLKDFYESDDNDFAHDFIGIQNNINRQTKTFENCFTPRFTR